MKIADVAAEDQDGTVVHELGAWKLALDVESLRRNAWQLSHRSGRFIDLTRAEHALIACLFATSTQRVSCTDVTRAILQVCAGPGNRQRRMTANLPVTLGRLRSKGRRAGLEIPIWLDGGPVPACCWTGDGQDW